MSESNGTPDRQGLCATVTSAVPGLFRLGVSSAMRTVEWVAGTATTATREILRGTAPSTALRTAVGQTSDEPVLVPRPISRSTSPSNGASGSGRGSTAADLRRRGAKLLYDSADVWYEDDTHPAYARILDELTPDEARILRFLAMEGPQPAIDIRTNRPLGVGSELVAGGLSMIGLQAGVRNVARTRADLNNLYRLGLVWFSREPVEDPTRYQVVEVQPDVLEVLRSAGRSPKTIHRSIHLTPFGEDFCAVCLPLEGNGRLP